MDDIEKRVTLLNILPTLQEQSADFIAHLQRYVWPSLEGADHAMLLYYYTLLGGCTERGQLEPDTHIKLLKRFQTIAPGQCSNYMCTSA